MANTSTYPLTKMNFMVYADSLECNASFTEITGIEASVDVIEFRQGNSGSLSPVKIPGLVKHGNVTLKMGYTASNAFKEWIVACTSSQRGADFPRKELKIELIDIQNNASPTSNVTTSQNGKIWILSNAWVAKYNGPDLDAKNSDVAIESMEIAYEELTIPN